MENQVNELARQNEAEYLSLLVSLDPMEVIESCLTERHFLTPYYGVIFKAIISIRDNGLKPTIIRLTDVLPNLPQVAELDYNTTLNATMRLKVLEEKILEQSIKDISITTLKSILEQLNNNTPLSTITQTLADIDELITPAVTHKQKIFRTATEYFEEIASYNPEKEFKVSLCRGITFPDGTLSYIGARPGGGKTSALVNIAREAIDTNRKVLFINLEMPFKSIATNYILSCMYAMGDDTDRHILDEEKEDPRNLYYKLTKEYGLANSELFVNFRIKAQERFRADCDSGKLTILDGADIKTTSQLIRYADKRIEEGTVVLLDFVQRMPIAGVNNSMRYMEIKQVSNDILKLALRKKAVVISGAQLKREAGKDVGLDSFREGGDIEQDAHNAISIEHEHGTGKPCFATKVLKAREGMIYEYTLLKSQLRYKYIIGTNVNFKPEKIQTNSKGKNGKNRATETETPQNNINPATGKIDWENI